MSERKLYFPGLGGNRYEISLEELQKQAYKGKIKRDDKIIVVKTKHGQTTEIETTCGKIRVAAEAFDQGESDRKAEAERKLAEKQAKEAARVALAQEKEAELARRQLQKNILKSKRTLTSEEPYYEPVQYAVKKFISIIITITSVIPILVCLFLAFNAFGPAYRLAYKVAYEATYDAAYKVAYDSAYNKAFEETYNKVYKEAYQKAYDEELQRQKNLLERSGKSEDSVDTASCDEVGKKKGKEIGDLEGGKAGVEAGKDAGDKAGKLAGKSAGVSAGIPAGMSASFLVILTKGVPATILILLLYLVMRSFLDVVLTLAQYRTETLRLAIINAVENANAKRLETNDEQKEI